MARTFSACRAFDLAMKATAGLVVLLSVAVVLRSCAPGLLSTPTAFASEARESDAFRAAVARWRVAHQ